MVLRKSLKDDVKNRITPELLQDIGAYLAEHFEDEVMAVHASSDIMMNMIPQAAMTEDSDFAGESAWMDDALLPQGDADARPAARPSQVHYSVSASHKAAAKKRSLDEVLGELSENFQQRLMRAIRERGYTEKEVYKRANLDRKVFSKIRLNENYNPKKSTAILLALGLRLTLDETLDLLSRAGYTLSNGSRSDLIVRYFIENEIYDVYELDAVLDEYGLPMLSNY